jgi:hypothetical protein
MTLQKNMRLTEARSLQFRAEAFNTFNHAQFYGPASVDGQRRSEFWSNRERGGSSAPARLRIAAKFTF